MRTSVLNFRLTIRIGIEFNNQPAHEKLDLNGWAYFVMWHGADARTFDENAYLYDMKLKL